MLENRGGRIFDFDQDERGGGGDDLEKKRLKLAIARAQTYAEKESLGKQLIDMVLGRKKKRLDQMHDKMHEAAEVVEGRKIVGINDD